MATVLIPALCNCSPHLEVELEIIEKHILNNDTIFYVLCNRTLKTCFHYYNPTFDECYYCMSKFKIGISLLSKKINLLKWPNEKKFHIQNKYSFLNVSDLMKFTIDNKAFGLSIASQMITELKNEQFDTVEYFDNINSHLDTSFFLYNSFMSIVNKIKPDVVYFFNGRFPVSYPILAICREKNINFYTHERGNNFNSFRLAHNSLPHDTRLIAKECNSIYNLYSSNEALKNAGEFYSHRRAGNKLTGFIYTEHQSPGRLPDNFDFNKINIVYFNSSEFEYCALPLAQHYGHYLYESDYDMLTKVAQDLSRHDNIHIYCRIHPNLANSNSNQVDSILNLHDRFKNLTIISPQNKIDSYALMDSSSIVIVNLSTMGAEASFWGKPVILVGDSLLNELDGFYKPKSHNELIHLLLNNLRPLPRTGAIKYGLWLQRGGCQFKYFVQNSLGSGEFKGIDLHKAAYHRYRFAKLCKIVLDLFFFYGFEEAKNSAKKVFSKICTLLCFHRK